MKKKFFLALLTAFNLSLNAQSPVLLEAFLRDSLDNYVAQGMAAWEIPGVSVCVVKNGKVLAEKGYGWREKGKPAPVDNHTLFMIGSNTKAFTGTALAMLEQAGKCSLKDRVQHWLPTFKMKDEWVANHLNLTDIVTHRMGMETFQGDFTYWTTDLTTAEVIEKFGKFAPTHDFRTQWGYTNAGYAIAGECIQAISGQSWADYLRTQIFQPLKMSRTLALSAEISKADNAARPHVRAKNIIVAVPFPMIDNLAPAGSIASSAHDMGLWAMAQLADGQQDGRKVIPAEAIARTREPQSIVGRGRGNSHYSLYGLGWFLQDYAGKELVSHTGGVNGFVTSVTLVPEENLGVVVLTNTDDNNFYAALNRQIVNAALGLPYTNLSQKSCANAAQMRAEEAEQVQAWRDTIAMRPAAALPLKSFAGRYEHEVYGFLDLREMADASLELTLQHHPGTTAKLECLGGNRFLCTFSDPTLGMKNVVFSIENQRVASLTLRVADFVEFTPYIFVKKN
jgi:CubicO group peptidase (beta-lactamase class C family)